MNQPSNRWMVAGSVLKNPRLLRLKPSLNRFMLAYIDKFKIRRIGKNWIIHSHFPPLNSRAYSLFVKRHLIEKSEGPSHAQIGLTNACPQKCAYCYNRDRTGRVMDKETILRAVRELQRAGVAWLGWTGGEPLLNKDIVALTEAASRDCAVKLFTTGCALTRELGRDLRNAGLFSVCVSLDDWREEVHDSGRGYPGAFRTALRAVETFLEIDGLHVGVSAVLSPEMIRSGGTEDFLGFLEGLGVHESWLSEVKPSLRSLWTDDVVIQEADRLRLVSLQDEMNRRGRMTVNYLGHFEGREHFGCNCGRKMVYIDAFGEVSPCVFTPMTFGNVSGRPLEDMLSEMRSCFASGESCFVNGNYRLFRKYSNGSLPLDRELSRALAAEAQFGHSAAFYKIFNS